MQKLLILLLVFGLSPAANAVDRSTPAPAPAATTAPAPAATPTPTPTQVASTPTAAAKSLNGEKLVNPVLIKELPSNEYHNSGAMVTGLDGQVYAYAAGNR